ncbi:VWA domain-containing protein [Candidatus Bathyarchaeota archaeon]|nr:VWA domain-containing protein [Candidatus Bathyarchaeota archaeon]
MRIRLYTAEISRGNPTCFIFLIDQSGSMEDPFGGEAEGSKAHAVADAINRLLQNLVLRCAKAEGVRDYFHVGVIGYGLKVGPAFEGELGGEDLVPISQIGDNPLTIEERTQKTPDGAGGIIEQEIKFPIWFKPVAKGPTPMKKALKKAENILTDWLMEHPDCYPPIVINISDGEPTDGDPSNVAQNIMELESSDGNVLLLNLHLSSSQANPIEFPDIKEALPDEFARLLYDMSSILPEKIRNEAESEGFEVSEESRGFIFNSDIVQVIQFIDIGTRATNLR